MGDIADHGQERGIDKGGPDSEEGHRRRPHGEFLSAGDEPNGHGLDPHPGHDETFPPHTVGPGAGDELPETPHRRVDGCQHTDAPHRDAGRGEEQW